MPVIPPVWRKYLYGVSIAVIPVTVIAGWVSDSLGVALGGLAYSVFVGGLAASNVPKSDA